MSLPRLFVSVLAAALLLAAAPVHAKETKIGVVDTQQIIEELADGKAALNRMKRWMEGKQKAIKAEEEALMNEGKVLQNQASVMNQETLVKKQTELQAKAQEFAKKVQQVQADAQQKEQEELGPVVTRINTVVSKLAQRDGLTVVLEKRAAGLAYLDASLDYTARVISQYNADYKKGASAKGGK